MDSNILELASRPSIPTLEKLALIKVTTMLSNNRKLLPLITNFPIFKRDDVNQIRMKWEWKKIRVKANELLSKICLTDFLNTRILEYLYTVSYRILSWKRLYDPFFKCRFIRHFYWTDQGRIDNRRTVQSIVRNETFSVKKRFALACCTGSREEIRDMWGKMSPSMKNYFLKRNRELIHPIIMFWTHAVLRLGDAIDKYFRKAVMCAVELSLLEAVQYFFNILTTESKRHMAVICMNKFQTIATRHMYNTEEEIDMGYFLFSQMSLQNQVKFSSSSSLLPLLLLRSSEEKHLRNYLTEILHSFSFENLKKLLCTIFEYYRVEVIDHISYDLLFFDVWNMLPFSTRNSFDESLFGPTIFAQLVMENFPFLLKEGSWYVIKNIMESRDKNFIIASPYENAFHRGKWNFLHKLILEEVVKSSSLERNKTYILNRVKEERILDENDWNEILRFVVKIEKNKLK